MKLNHPNSGLGPGQRFCRRGVTLIELVVVISSLTTLMLLIAATLWGAVKIERADAATFRRITVQSQLADQFRADVGHAAECVDALVELQASPTCLILKFSDDYHVVYRWRDERLRRTEFDGGAESALPLSAGAEQMRIEFVRSPDGRVITLRLIESRGPRASRRDWPVEISAALGGLRQ